ncbi:MAG: L,D-transpeptidase [Patescibacteria group bacterium]
MPKQKKSAFVPFQKMYGWKLCKTKGFRCEIISKAIGWKKFWPDDREREIIMKLNRLNIKLLLPGMPVAIPENMAGKTLADWSPFPKKTESPGEKFFLFDPGLLAWAAYDKNGNLVRWGPALGGNDYCRDIHRQCRTIVGDNFRVGIKGNANSRSGAYPIGCGGKNKPCAPMPWVMYFYKHYYGIHGSNKMIGWNASHGCVRTFNDDAEWLHKNFIEIGTRVIVKPYL